MRKYLVAAALMVAVAGCQNKKKSPPPEAINNPPAQPPVPYVPPSNAGPTEVSAAPTDTATPADTSPDVSAAPAPAKSKTGHSTGHSSGHITGKTYVIKKGDTLYSISRARYGTNAHVKDIEAANPGLNPDKLQVGQKIKLP